MFTGTSSEHPAPINEHQVLTLTLEDGSEAEISHPCNHSGCSCESFKVGDMQLLQPEQCNECSHGWAVHGMIAIPQPTIPDRVANLSPRASWRERVAAAQPAAAQPAASAATAASSTYRSPAKATASAATASAASADSSPGGSAMSLMLARMRASPAAAQAVNVAVKARSPYAPNNTYALNYFINHCCFLSRSHKS
jgi:hypothetical protein